MLEKTRSKKCYKRQYTGKCFFVVFEFFDCFSHKNQEKNEKKLMKRMFEREKNT